MLKEWSTNEQVTSCPSVKVRSWANWQTWAKMAVFERAGAVFGLWGSDRVPAVGSILFKRKLISCNQMPRIIVFVSFPPPQKQQQGFLFNNVTWAFVNSAVTLHWNVSPDTFYSSRTQRIAALSLRTVTLSVALCVRLYLGKERKVTARHSAMMQKKSWWCLKNGIIKQYRAIAGKWLPIFNRNFCRNIKNSY